MLTQEQMWEIREKFHSLPSCIEINTRIDVGLYGSQKFYSHADICKIIDDYVIKSEAL